MKRWALLLGLFLPLHADSPLFAGDKKSGDVDFFERRIRPLLTTNCLGCHSHEAAKLRGELYLDSRPGVRTGGKRGPAVVPGKPAESLLIQAVRYEGPLRMPPKGKLSAAEIADLEAWVKMGAPDPRDDKVAKRKPIDVKEGKTFWSFQPVKDAAPPAVKDKAWPANAIDRFILSKLEAKDLKPAAKADKQTLLRRATFDLIGLPPTPVEIEAFLKDDSPEAFAKVIDRLLASTHYGERWGRHWLDVVRYADTAGDNSDYPIPQMVRYRNWVIDAFNKDMPYDRFVQEQLAGDLLPADSDADRKAKIVATGYLANSRRHGSYEDARYPWHLTIEDTIDNLGKAFLGLTIHCARCHDHKFDPLTADDYYALYGFFSSTRYPWPGIELDRVPKDMVPLAGPEEVKKASQEREAEKARLEEDLKTREVEKARWEKMLKVPDASPAQLEAARAKIAEASLAIAARKKERDAALRKPLPFETAYAVIDGKNEPKKRIGIVGNARLQLKGDPERLGREVPRRFPSVLGGFVLPAEVKGSGRLELAGWLTDRDNPLFARVMVNRVWQYHFGEGIVATPNDFGKQGRGPTHPELLDYLAKRFMDGGWSLKALHREIMLSRTYQQSSHGDAASEKLDLDNALLSRFPVRRLDAEAIRDSLLAVSGQLDRSAGGPHPFPEPAKWDFTQHKPFKAVYDTNRRSVYQMTQRIQRHPFLALFDGPDTNASTDRRVTTTTPLQALFLMNNPFVYEQAKGLAARLLKERLEDGERVEQAFLLMYGRRPEEAEKREALDYLATVSSKLPASAARHARAWESLARVLFLSNEFVYLD